MNWEKNKKNRDRPRFLFIPSSCDVNLLTRPTRTPRPHPTSKRRADLLCEQWAAQRVIAVRCPAYLIYQSRFQFVAKQFPIGRLAARVIHTQCAIHFVGLNQRIDLTLRIRSIT